MYEWTIGYFPVPEWVAENDVWAISFFGLDWYFEPKDMDGKGASNVWLAKYGEVLRWTGRDWYIGEQRLT